MIMSTSLVRDIIVRGVPFHVAGHVGLSLGDERVSIMRIGQVKGQVWYAKDFESQYRLPDPLEAETRAAIIARLGDMSKPR